jgi:hypothetical protein
LGRANSRIQVLIVEQLNQPITEFRGPAITGKLRRKRSNQGHCRLHVFT